MSDDFKQKRVVKSGSKSCDSLDDKLMLIKKIKLLIAECAFLFSSLYPSLRTSRVSSFSFYFLLNSRAKQTWPLRALHWCQSSLMSAWLIGRNFINARSIEIGDDIGEVRRWRTATRFYASTRVFIKYDLFPWRSSWGRYSRIGKIDRVAMWLQLRRRFSSYKSHESNFAKDIIHRNLVLNKIICTAFRF